MATKTKRMIWQERLRACERSGLSRRAWCEAHGVNVHALAYWRYRLREDMRSPSEGLIPIRVPSLPAAIEIALPGGVQVRVPVGFPADEVIALVRGLSC